jgi:hypothetical protein
MEQLDLFPDMPKIEPIKQEYHCKDCDNLVSVRFNNGNLFFCYAQKQHGGRYGKKIKKSLTVVNCEFYEKGEGLIPHIDGYYGDEASKGIKR